MAIEKELLDQLLAGRDPSEVFGKDGLLDDLKKALSERIFNAELDDHLDVERLEGGPANRRNGSSKKTVLTGTSKMTLTIPRDRAGTFDPMSIPDQYSPNVPFESSPVCAVTGLPGRAPEDRSHVITDTTSDCRKGDVGDQARGDDDDLGFASTPRWCTDRLAVVV